MMTNFRSDKTICIVAIGYLPSCSDVISLSANERQHQGALQWELYVIAILLFSWMTSETSPISSGKRRRAGAGYDRMFMLISTS